MSRWIRLLTPSLAFVLASAAFAAHLNFSGASGGSSSAPCNAGGVVGTIGKIEDWENESGNEWSECTGYIGGTWSGSQYDNRVATVPYTTDERIHEYTMVGSGTPDNPMLRVEAHFTWMNNGLCSIMYSEDPSWWWHPYVSVANLPPKVQKQVGSSSEWTDLSFDQEFQSDEQAFGWNWDELGAYSSGAPAYGAPTASSITHSGHFRAAAVIAALPNSAKVRVVFPYSWSAQADVDNAIVTNWRERAKLRCFSQALSAEDADADDDGHPDEFSVYDPVTGDHTGDYPQ